MTLFPENKFFIILFTLYCYNCKDD